ncbi:MAG: ABC-2 family transporter protein [Defluviitaleaceae bacterium]|nr:ABC-2 family transporter protein [Defluviitaleaceae bacterium]
MGLYMKFFSMHLKSQMQYKTSFYFTALGQFLASFTVFLGIYFMFSIFEEVEGFAFSEVLLSFAVMLMAFSLAEMFGRGFDLFPRMLGNGQFDRALVRPRSIIFQTLAMQMDFTRLGRAAQALIVLIYAIPASGVHWSPDRFFTLFLMIVCGSLIFFALFMIYAAFSFFTVEGLEFMNIFTDGGVQFGRYPFSIYGEGILRFLTFVIPLALVQYYPLLYLLGREDSLLYMFAPLMGTIFLLPAYGFFRFGLSQYKSTGS